jgi:hypothetical protein
MVAVRQPARSMNASALLTVTRSVALLCRRPLYAGLQVVPSAAVGVRQMPEAGSASLQRAAEPQAAIGFILRGRVALTPRAGFARDGRARFAVELQFDAR